MSFFDDGAATFKSYVDGGIAQRDAQITDLQGQVASRDTQINTLNLTVAGLQQQVKDLQAKLNSQTPAATDTPPSDVYKVNVISGDATSLIQNALNTHKKILLSDGQFNCGGAIYLDSGMELWLSDNTVLIKNYSSSSGPSGAFIRNRDLTKNITDNKIIGKGEISAAAGKNGGILGLNATRLVVKNWKTKRWSVARHTLLIGDDCYVGGVNWDIGNPDASSGTGGLRFEGGKNFVCENSHIVSGDDVFQFVPAGAPNDPFFNAPDCVNGVYRNCTGQSYDGRLCVAGLQDQNDDGTTRLGMKSGVHDCRFENISGFSGKSAFVHQNKSSTGTITGTKTKNVVISRKYAVKGQAGEVFLNGVASTGGIDNIDLSGVTITDHRETAGEHDHPIFVQQGKVTNVVKPQGA